MKLHADDAGYSQKSNQAVKRLLDRGQLTSISVLANGQSVKDALNIIRQKQLPVFLHFNLIEGKPISPPATIPSIIKNGAFIGRKHLIFRLFTKQVRTYHVRSELTAQFNRLMHLGLNVGGIDSHDHLHALSPIAEVVAEVANRKKLLVRSYNLMQTQTPAGEIKYLALRLLASLTHLIYFRRLGLPISWKQRSWLPFFIASWEEIHPLIQNQTVLIVHPGLPFDKNIVNSGSSG